MEKHLYWSVIPVQGGKEEVLASIEKLLSPYFKEFVGRVKFELTDGDEGLDDDEISSIIHSLFDGPIYWDDFEKVPTMSEMLEMFMPYINVDSDGWSFHQYMDTSTLTENTFFLKLSSDSSEGENEHCEFQEFLTTVLSPLMTTKYSVGGWTSFSDGRLVGAGAYAFNKDGVEVPIQKLADSSCALA